MLYIRNNTDEIVTAIQYDGENMKQIISVAGKHVYLMHDPLDDRKMYVVDSPSGLVELKVNDWVVKVNGFYYHGKPEMFDKYYRPFYS